MSRNSEKAISGMAETLVVVAFGSEKIIEP